METSFFLQNGCPAYSMDHLFAEGWIGRFSPIHYLPRSPDIIRLDFFIRIPQNEEYIQRTLLHDSEVLKEKIQDALNEMNDPQTIREVQYEIIIKAEKYVEGRNV